MRKPLSETDDAISESLVNARLRAEPLTSFPGSLPDTLEQAYAIQAASIERWYEEVGAWKVAKLSTTDRRRFLSDRLIGPVFKSSIRRVKPNSLSVMKVYTAGFAAVEAEYALELSETVRPSDRSYSDGELADLVSAVYGAAEIASSPLAVVNSIGAMAVIPDFGANCGLVVGPKIPNWRLLPARSLTASVTVDDVSVGETTTESINSDPLNAMRFLIELCGDRGIVLPEGTLISTGALTGVHEVALSSTARLDFGSIGSFEIRFKAATRVS